MIERLAARLLTVVATATGSLHLEMVNPRCGNPGVCAMTGSTSIAGRYVKCGLRCGVHAACLRMAT